MDNRSCPVDVISVCTAEGVITPLRLRIRSEDRTFVVVDIEQILSRKRVMYVGVETQVFLCRGTLEDQPWLFELRYTLRSHNWSLDRRVY